MMNVSDTRDCAFEAFITNLGKYNEGFLVGEWVKFPVTNEEMQAVFRRIGIGRPPGRKPVVDWVLSRPRSKDDTEAFEHAVAQGAEAVLSLIDNGLEKTQQRFN